MTFVWSQGANYQAVDGALEARKTKADRRKKTRSPEP